MLPFSRLAVFEYFPGAAECHHGGGHAAVDRGLQQDLLDLVLGEAVVQGAVEMELQLMLLAERGQHAEVQHRAHLARQPGPVPDVVPAVGVEQLGELAVEVVNPGHRLVDPLGAEHVATCFQAAPVALLVVPLVHFASVEGWISRPGGARAGARPRFAAMPGRRSVCAARQAPRPWPGASARRPRARSPSGYSRTAGWRGCSGPPPRETALNSRRPWR